MFPATSFNGQTIAIFGLARSGLACARSLIAAGADVLLWDDSETAVERARSDGLPVMDLRNVEFAPLDALVLSPGVPLTHPEPHWTVRKARDAGIPVIGDTEVFLRQIAGSEARVVAITGTNGKSTTTALIGHVLRSAGCDTHIGGNIGKAVFLLPKPGRESIYVLELSSYQIDLTPSLSPDVGILMNLSPDHLDRHGTMANYAGVKAKMFAAQGERDTAIVSIDDEWCRAIADAHVGPAHLVRMSVLKQIEPGVSCVDGTVRLDVGRDGDRCSIDISGARGLRGRHNWQNACAAVAAADALGLCSAEISRGLLSFPGLAHRMEEVGRRGHVIYVNDSKATNADAAAMALAAFEHIYWIAGGLAKSGGIDGLERQFGAVKKAYLIGEAADQFARSLGGKVPFEICVTLDCAVEAASRDALADHCPEAVVLLSPACASFDQFPDFEKRGEAFTAAVGRLDGVDMNEGEAA